MTYRKLIADAEAMRVPAQLATELVEGWRNGNTLVGLLLGSSGTGKTAFALDICHRLGAKKPFIKIDCSALSADQLKDVLHGHVRGAYTGAVSPRKGAMERADGGVIFLDEIGDADDAAQLILRDAIQSATTQQNGGNTTKMVDVRWIVATNRDLFADVQAGRFRNDLFWRLAGIAIVLPALAERAEDIPAMAAEIARTIKPSPATLAEGCSEVLTSYDWPGNARQLQSVLDAAASASAERIITADRLRWEIERHRSVMDTAQCSDPSDVVTGAGGVEPSEPHHGELALVMAARGELRPGKFERSAKISRMHAWRILNRLVEQGRLQKIRRGAGFVYSIPRVNVTT